MKDLGGRMVELGLSLLAAAWLIGLAFSIIRPLLPLLGVLVLGGVVLRLLLRRQGL